MVPVNLGYMTYFVQTNKLIFKHNKKKKKVNYNFRRTLIKISKCLGLQA